MGTITARKRKDGSTAYLARVRRGGYHDTATFDTKAGAREWIAKREVGKRGTGPDMTLAEVIERYTSESLAAIGRTKAQTLRSLKGRAIGRVRCSRITSELLVALARELRAEMQPQTVANYLSHLGAVFAIARPAWGVPLDQQAMADAIVVSKRLGYTGKSQERDRRPTIEELDKLMAHFEVVRVRRPGSVPMQDVVVFALYSTRRQEEITRLRWADLDVEGSRILVRDMKHPGDKQGNHQWCDLPAEALAIIESQPRRGELIFPYSTDAIGAAFTRACKFLGIEDLHFHDLRHDGVSRLFEIGLSIPRVASVSGHRSWQSLKRYTHIRQTGDRLAGWQAKRRPALPA